MTALIEDDGIRQWKSVCGYIKGDGGIAEQWFFNWFLTMGVACWEASAPPPRLILATEKRNAVRYSRVRRVTAATCPYLSAAACWIAIGTTVTGAAWWLESVKQRCCRSHLKSNVSACPRVKYSGIVGMMMHTINVRWHWKMWGNRREMQQKGGIQA